MFWMDEGHWTDEKASPLWAGQSVLDLPLYGSGVQHHPHEAVDGLRGQIGGQIGLKKTSKLV